MTTAIASLFLSLACALFGAHAGTAPVTRDAPARSVERVSCAAERIRWSADVPLAVGDFRGALGDPRHSAEANTGIATESRAGADAATFVVEATAFFDPCKSWFRPSDDAAATLAHEQLHFDITEVFARRLIARYAESIDSHAEFLRRHEHLYAQNWRASRELQRAYDADVYADPARQAVWRDRIAADLAATAAFADKRVALPMR